MWTPVGCKSRLSLQPPGEKRQLLLNPTLPCQEDEAVRKLVDKHGDKSWVLVASFLPNRTGKQIRERWHNQLDPNIMKGKPATSHILPLTPYCSHCPPFYQPVP